MSLLSVIFADLKRYSNHGKFEWFEPSILVIILYRLGHSIQLIGFKPLRWLLAIVHLPFYMVISFFSGIHIARGAKIGAGLRIFHFGCIVINSGTIIGENCTIRHGVTFGNRHDISDVPIVGNNVEVGAGAKILGRIIIGNNVAIGANAVVLRDVPDDSIAVGVPARILPKIDRKNSYYENRS